MRIAIQGELGSFHHVATLRWFGEDAAIVPAESFDEVFGLLNRFEAGAAVVAIENSLYGGISHVYDLLESHRYPIIGEVHVPVHQQLIGTPGADVKQVYSHPVALAQCSDYLGANYPNAARIEFHDTAAAVEYVKQLGDPRVAAIASREAALLHNLPIIAENIEDNPANFTRFLVVKPNGTPPPDANRTTLVITTNHTPGALAKVLTVFAELGINLSKLQSRPIIGKPWHYRFYLVLDTAGAPLETALADIQPFITESVVLGQYRRDA